MSDNNPEILEKEKDKHLKGKTVPHIKEVPGWNAHLASDAEAVVKAERESADSSVEEMQKHTVEVLKDEAEADEEHARTKTA